MVLVMSILTGGQIYVNVADQFTLDTKTTIKKLKARFNTNLYLQNAVTRTVITGEIKNPPSGTINIPVKFITVNDDIVTAGFHDEYFACGYVISYKTGLEKIQM